MPKFRLDPSHWLVSLSMDALYFAAAEHHLAQASLERGRVGRTRRALRILEGKERQLQRRATRCSAAADELHNLGVQIVDGAIPDYEAAFRPYLEALAVTHICAAAAVEAHVNRIAADLLGNTEFNRFDRLSLEGKWLALPLFASATPVPASDYRFGRVRALTRTRNALVHYKVRREDWRQGRAPKFVKQLGLAYPEARKSVETARLAINAVASMINQPEPEWTRGTSLSYFVHTHIPTSGDGA